jgi:tetratricopeptide (TPR) repeat protein
MSFSGHPLRRSLRSTPLSENGSSPCDQALELQCRLALARAAGRAGNLNEAYTAAHQALGLSQRVEFLAERAEAHNIIGGVAFERGELTEAERHYNQALRLARDSDHHDVAARAANNLASICHLRGDVGGARRMYFDNLQTHRESRDRRGQAEALHNLALTYRESGDTTTALQLSAAAREHAIAVGDSSLIAMIICGEAEGALNSGATERAIMLIELAVPFARQAGDPLRQSEVDRVRAACLARRGDVEIALKLVADASANAELHSARLLQADCATTAAEVLAGCGRASEATASFATAIRLFHAAGAKKHVMR